MPRTTRSILLVPLVAAALFGAAGCSSLIPGAPSSTGSPGSSGGGSAPAGGGSAPASTDDPVAWVDQVCGAMIPFVEAASSPPSYGATSDPDELSDSLGTYLGDLGDAAGTAAREVEALGPAPVDGGEEIANNLTTTLTSIETSFGDASDTLASGSNDPSALTDALAPLEQLATNDPTADLNNNAELNAAAQQAANCQQLETTFGPGGR